MKREIDKYDFKALGQAIKVARKTKGLSRNQLADRMGIAPRYMAVREYHYHDREVMAATLPKVVYGTLT